MTEDNMYNRYIKKGNSDFKVALRELSSEDPEFDIACFHFQQFAEK